jgi:DNA-binding protein HU-beta
MAGRHADPAQEAARPAGMSPAHHPAKEIDYMAKAAAKPMTKSEILSHLADKVGVTKKQVSQLLEEQADLACKQAKTKGMFVVPNIGKLVLSERPARKMMMRFGPKAGQMVDVPKKKVVKFRVSKAAKDAILGAKK